MTGGFPFGPGRTHGAGARRPGRTAALALGFAWTVWVAAASGAPGMGLGIALAGGASGGPAAGAGAPGHGVGSAAFRGTAASGGPTLGPRPIDQLDRAVRQPLPSVPPPRAPRQESIWVPDRYIDRPEGIVHVPGHWERRLNSQEHSVPPLTVCTHGTAECTQVPAGVRPPPENRQSP